MVCSTPILLLGFNRPDLSRRVLDVVRRVRPTRLYFAVDGPREGRAGELSLCEEVRALAQSVDWDCDIKTLFQDKNLGCRLGVSSAISWFFDHEESGVILEDDCVPAASFFPYAEELLERYAEEPRVMAVSGDNFVGDRPLAQHSYRFSRYPHVWGWATWRRAWASYDIDMKLWPEFRDYGGLAAISCGNSRFEEYWSGVFDRVARGEIDTWDYQWTFACWLNNGLACVPKVNLVTNVGFDERATHTTSAKNQQAYLEARDLDLPLTHPNFIVRDAQADALVDAVCFGIKPASLRRRITSLFRGT